MTKVLLFIKSVDSLNHKKVGLFLETNKGLVTDLAVVKSVCNPCVVVSINGVNGMTQG